mgnify:FL=1
MAAYEADVDVLLYDELIEVSAFTACEAEVDVLLYDDVVEYEAETAFNT